MRKHDLLQACWGTEVPKPSYKLVLLCLAHHYNVKTGQCNPKQSRIAEMTGLSRKTVNEAIRYLRDQGVIDVTRKWTLQCSFMCSMCKFVTSDVTDLHISPEDGGLISRDQLDMREWNKRLRELEEREICGDDDVRQ